MLDASATFALLIDQECRWATMLERANTAKVLAPRQKRLLIAEAEGALKALADLRTQLMATCDPP